MALALMIIIIHCCATVSRAFLAFSFFLFDSLGRRIGSRFDSMAAAHPTIDDTVLGRKPVASATLSLRFPLDCKHHMAEAHHLIRYL